MVHLTMSLAVRCPPPDRFWKRQMIRRLTWHFHGRKRNCYALSLNYLRRALRYATQHRRLKKIHMTQLFETRIAAACAEHGVQYSTFVSTLREADIALDRKVLSELCIYEPRTFQSLCELVKKRYMETFNNNLNPSRRIFTRGML